MHKSAIGTFCLLINFIKSAHFMNLPSVLLAYLRLELGLLKIYPIQQFDPIPKSFRLLYKNEIEACNACMFYKHDALQFAAALLATCIIIIHKQRPQSHAWQTH